MNRKKFLAVLLVFCMGITVLSGCGNNENTDDTAGSAESIVIRVGYENNPGEPIDEAMKKWATLLSEKSGGTMTMELLPSGKFGEKDEIIDRMQKGEAVMTLADGTFFADRGIGDMGILAAPYLFDSWEECWKLTGSDWWKEKEKELEQNGIKVVSSDWIYGDRHLLTKEPVNSAEDIKGMKIRVPDNAMQRRGMEVMGAEAVPMALGDSAHALRNGTVDGLENPLPALYSGNFHEDAKYLLLDSHMKNFTTWICSTEFFNSLTAEQQKILMETGDEAGLYNNTLQEKAEKDALQKLKAEGVTVKELTEEERAAFAEAAKGFYTDEETVKDWSDSLYDKIRSVIGRL